MKFRKIAFKDHPVLGDVKFDFTDTNGQTVDTIIIAGENGCGKSMLLSFMNNYDPIISAKDLGYSLKVEVELTEDDLRKLQEDKIFTNSFGKRVASNIVTFVHSISFPDDNSRVEYETKEGSKQMGYAFQFNSSRCLCKTVFSDVEINFSPNQINHPTSSNLDDVFSASLRSSSNLATEITQLLVDINELDNEELAKWCDQHKGQAPLDEVLHKRIRRFTKAFDLMFPHKRFVGVDNRNNHKVVLFEEFGKEMEISQLSSGEKQIVFRGGFLLRNQGTIVGAPVLVDEPELSLHPQWQLKILNFLKGLFTNEKGIQTSQIIVATHSPFILHNNTRSNDKVIIMQKTDDGKVVVLDKPDYYNWSETSAVEEAFNVVPLLTKKKVIVFLEGETDEVYFRKAIEVYGFDSNVLSFNWIGHYAGGDKGKAENTGDTALNNASAFFKANPYMIQRNKIYLLYDCDTKKPKSQEGNIYIGAMTKNVNATIYKIGVENLLELPADFDYSRFYKNSSKTDCYGAESTITVLDKTALAEYITNLPDDQLMIILKNVKSEVDTILERISEK